MRFWETEHNEDDFCLSCQSVMVPVLLFSKWKKQGLYQLREGMCLVPTIYTRLMSNLPDANMMLVLGSNTWLTLTTLLSLCLLTHRGKSDKWNRHTQPLNSFIDVTAFRLEL